MQGRIKLCHCPKLSEANRTFDFANHLRFIHHSKTTNNSFFSSFKVLLQSSTLKLLLIRTSRTSKCFIEPDSPLPSVVRKALPVLPSLDWNLGQSERVNGKFWTLLRKALPKNQVRPVTGVISHAHFGHNDHRNQE